MTVGRCQNFDYVIGVQQLAVGDFTINFDVHRQLSFDWLQHVSQNLNYLLHAISDFSQHAFPHDFRQFSIDENPSKGNILAIARQGFQRGLFR